MKIVSFDIGLRNLAVCVLEGTSRKDMKITHWEIIDVLAEQTGETVDPCYKCGKQASWLRVGTAPAVATYCCSIHKPRIRLEKPPTKKSLNENTLELLHRECNRLCITLEGKTKKEAVDKIYSYHQALQWKRCVKSANKVSIVDCAYPLHESLSKRQKHWEGATHVICEQQPEARMISVQAMVQMWFICNSPSTTRVSGISAVHKLSNTAIAGDNTRSYKGRKSTGITHALELLGERKTVSARANLAFMETHAKKDDLADCFLQGLWFMENRAS
jgi:hypothetical protein